ncbi:MAG: ABC transporter substrate-binding protein [Candidatus Bipolaricaulota bacterium]|nr:ABC transporter substrate-binding protein [Candidatus Bipolaricaulota bacterium]
MQLSINRRKFLKALGLTTAATALAGPLRTFGQGTIKIGVITGLETVFGEGTRNAALMAIDEINRAGGLLGRQLEVVVGDVKTELDGTLSRTVFQDLGSKTDAIVGLFRSESVLALLPDIPRVRKPYIITGATSLATDNVVTNYDNFKYVFRGSIVNTYSLVVDTLRFMGDYVYELVEKGVLPNRSVVMINEDLSSGNLFMSLIGPRLGELGFNIVNQFRLAVGTRDLAPVLTQIGGTRAAIGVTFFSDPGLGTGFPATWSQTRTRIALFGINAPLQADPVVEQLRGAATGYVIADFSADAPMTEKTKPFFKNYQDRFKIRPVYTAGTTYDAIYMLAEAIKAAGSTEADRVVAALERVNTIGVGGPLSFYSRAEYDRAERERVKIETKAGDLTLPNTISAGITNLSLINPHDIRYGLRKGDRFPYDGVRPIHSQIQTKDGALDRQLLYPGEFSDKPSDPLSLYQLPPHMR